jgi:hypothetical protein
MISTLFKKKLSEDQLSNIFVNGVIEVVDKGFEEVASLIDEDPAFVERPNVLGASDGHFTMIVIATNISCLKDSFDPSDLSSLEKSVNEKFAEVFDMELATFEKYLNDYTSFLSRVNHPSKTMLYSMSKGIFYKYKLNQFQDEYFRRLDCPNPLFLKRMDEVMKNFLWNWDAFFKRYKMHSF